MKKTYQKPGVDVLYFGSIDIMTDTSKVPLYTAEEMKDLHLDVRSYQSITWE